MFDVQVLGRKELEKALHDLPDKVERKVLSTAMRGALKTTMDRIHQLVRRETGALERRLGELKATAPESAWAVRAVALADDALALVNGAPKRFDFEGEVSAE